MKFYFVIIFASLVLFSNLSYGGVKLGTQLWAPYQKIEKGEVCGISVKIVRCILDRLHEDVSIVPLPWLRAQLSTQRGELDGFFAASQSDARDQFAVMSRPFIKQEWRIYFLQHEYKEASLKNVRDFYRLGARLNSNVAYWAKKDNFVVNEVSSEPSKLITLLLHDRIDAYVENSVVFEHNIKQLGLKKSQFYSMHFKHHPLGVYFSKNFLGKHRNFIESFNRSIDLCLKK